MAAVAWPISVCLGVLIFAIFFCFRFRNEISRFIDRTKRVSKEGVETDSLAVVTQEVKDITKPSPVDELLRPFDNRLIVEQEGLIRSDLDNSQIRGQERERVLLRYLASAYIVQRFENVYHLIWGSQIRALQQLNESEPLGVLRNALEPWYDLGRIQEPDWYAHYSFDQWYSFMERMTLAVNQAGTVHITVFGNEFLKYMIQNTYSTNKRG